MKIYIAGKFEKKDEVRRIYKLIQDSGHEVAYDWTQHKTIKPYEENHELAKEYSQNEINGVIDSDIFIYLVAADGTTIKMEFGVALALSKTSGKPKIYAVGPLNQKLLWLHHPNVILKDTIEEVLEEIS